MNRKQVTDFREDLTDTLAALVVALRAEMRGMEKRLLGEIEKSKSFDYVGTYRQGQSHRKGQSVTHQGSLWIATENYPRVPGTPNSGWKLAVKKGRDAR